jgi:hypothetical protein
MGRATEFYYYINQEEVDEDEELLYTHLTITNEIEQIRQDHLITKKSGLKAKGDGSFNLF